MKEKASDLKPDVMEVYSDGACSPNPGIGGYGYVVRFQNPIEDSIHPIEQIVTGSEGFRSTTNNRMELQGCLEGLLKAMELLHAYRTFVFKSPEDYQEWKLREFVRDTMLSIPGATIISEQKCPMPDVYMIVTIALPFKQINILSDSSYLCRGFDKGWVKKWKVSGWLTSDGKPVKNVDLWQAIDAELETLHKRFGLRTHFICVPGHRGYKFNEVCDQLAVKARKDIARNP